MIPAISHKSLESDSIEELFRLLDQLNNEAQSCLEINAEHALQYLVDARVVSDVLIERLADYLED